MYAHGVTHRKEGRVFTVGQQHPRPLNPLADSVRERAIETSSAKSSSPIDNSITCRHAVMIYAPAQRIKSQGYKASQAK
jgi:hypothetical protein